MAMGKNYRVLQKSISEQAHSVILEHRSRPETLLFESGCVANLCKKLLIFLPLFHQNLIDNFSSQSCSRNRSSSKAIRQDSRRLRMSGRFTIERWRIYDSLLGDGHWVFLRR